MAVKSKELADPQETTAMTKATEAEADRTLADANQEMQDITAQMKEDTLLFDETKASCATQADEWMERVRLRTATLAGIEKARGTRNSRKSKKLFEKAIKPAAGRGGAGDAGAEGLRGATKDGCDVPQLSPGLARR